MIGVLHALLARLAQHARALFLVGVDEDRVGVRRLELDDVGGEIHLPRLGRDVGDDLDVARRHLLEEHVAPALAVVVVHPQERHRLRLDALGHEHRHLRHAHLLAERGAEDVVVAHLRDLGGLRAGDLRDLGLLREQHVHLHRAGEHRAEDHVGVAVDRLLHLGARDARVALRVAHRRVDLALEDAALRVDLVDRHQRAVAEVGARHRAVARHLDHDRHEHRLLRLRRRTRCLLQAAPIQIAFTSPPL